MEHGFESDNEYVRVLVKAGTALNEAHRTHAKVSRIVEILTDLAQSTGHQIEVNKTIARKLRKTVNTWDKEGTTKYLGTSLYSTLENLPWQHGAGECPDRVPRTTLTD